MGKFINRASKRGAEQKTVKCWNRVDASEERFINSLNSVGGQRYGRPADLVFNDKDVLLLETNSKGIFVWKSKSKNIFRCTVFKSRSETPRLKLVENAVAALRAIHPTAILEVTLGSELIELGTGRILFSAGFKSFTKEFKSKA